MLKFPNISEMQVTYRVFKKLFRKMANKIVKG